MVGSFHYGADRVEAAVKVRTAQPLARPWPQPSKRPCPLCTQFARHQAACFTKMTAPNSQVKSQTLLCPSVPLGPQLFGRVSDPESFACHVHAPLTAQQVRAHTHAQGGRRTRVHAGKRTSCS